MSILFVLLTFLLILTIMYFRGPQEAPALQTMPAKSIAAPVMLRSGDFEVPQGYRFHPGHTWLLDEGHQDARVGVDAFAGNLMGNIDAIDLAPLNRWVRQGQKLCTLKHQDRSVELLSPVEGVLVSLNHEVVQDPNLIVEDPYERGWLCVIKAPELGINSKNLLQGPLVAPWMQNCFARVSAMLQASNPALAQDGGLPVKGVLFQVESKIQRQLSKEFFLT